MAWDYPDPNQYFKELNVNADEVRKITDFVPDIAIILGSGLSGFTDNIEVVATVNCKELFNFPVPTAPGHKGNFVFGYLNGAKVVCLSGRVHYYEGYPMHEVAKPIRLMYLLGARAVIITNACGALNPYYNVGDICAVYDHISSFVPSPLLGPNIAQLGEKFVDMNDVYDYNLLKGAINIADAYDIPIRTGVYLQVRGPQYESPMETRMYHSFGADVVAMSATCEAIAARHMGMKVSQLSLVTNMTGGLQTHVDDEEVHINAKKSSNNFATLVKGQTKYCDYYLNKDHAKSEESIKYDKDHPRPKRKPMVRNRSKDKQKQEDKAKTSNKKKSASKKKSRK